MSDINKQAVQAVADLKAGYTLGQADVAILNELARIALASLEAEAVGEVVLGEYDDCGCHPDAKVVCIAADGQADWENFKDGTRLYTAPPAPVSVPAAMEMDDDFDSAFEHGKAVGWNACRAAMLQGAEPVTTAYKLPAIGWLRADYQNDNRGLRGNAPLFVLGKKDPSTVWGLDYIPLISNSPVITDGWVACSERMPDIGIEIFYFCQDDGLRDCGIVSSSNFSDRGDAQLYVHAEGYDLRFGVDITHWMPLPAAPQQEVK